MKKVLAALILVLLALTHVRAANEERGTRVVLPNAQLLRCKSSDCLQVWSENSVVATAAFPKQVVIDADQGCIYGMTALYDKSIPVDDVRAAIDERYGRWAQSEFVTPSLRIWRVESEQFAIQLSVMDKKDQKQNRGEAGTKRVIYLPLGGPSVCK
jgi:hypothetical protein